MPPPPPPPPFPDELVEEVLLRLPPHSAASLVRAGLVCKRWCGLVSDPGFRRRFREFHRSPPMLGFLYHGRDTDGVITRFVPMSAGSCPPIPCHRRIELWDSRHGRVLFDTYPTWFQSIRTVVWDPVTDEWLELPRQPSMNRSIAAVLCAATPGGTCDHLDCHRGPFIVVLLGTKCDKVYSYVYSSDSGAWSGPTSTAKLIDDNVGRKRSAVVGNLLYFVSAKNKSIIEYDLVTRKISVINLPADPWCQTSIELTTTEDGRLGFTRLENFRLCLLSREVEDSGWSLSKVIDLADLIPRRADVRIYLYLVGSAEGVGVIFLTVADVLYTVDLRTERMTKVYPALPRSSSMVVPYMNFYTPVLRARSTNGRPTEGAASSA